MSDTDNQNEVSKLFDQLVEEADLAGGNPTVFESKPWIGVLGDMSWIESLGYDLSPWNDTFHPRDETVELVLPKLAKAARHVSVVTRSVVWHNPPTHNGIPDLPPINSNRGVILVIP